MTYIYVLITGVLLVGGILLLFFHPREKWEAAMRASEPYTIRVEPIYGPLTEKEQEYARAGFSKVLINGTECYTRPSPPVKPRPRRK